MSPKLVVVAAGFVVLCVFGLVMGGVAGRGGAGDVAGTGSCMPAGLGGTGGAGAGALTAGGLDPHQRDVVAHILNIGAARGFTARGWQVALQAGATESKLRNLDHGDRDSLGVFQMRHSMGWGTPAQLRDVPYQVHKFYDVLAGVVGWEQMRPGVAAQRVERSGFPDRYHEFEQLATDLIAGYRPATGPGAAGGGAVQAARSGCGEPSAGSGGAIEFALKQQGKPYVWAASGPDAFDCSGLVLRAYQAAGVRLPRTSREQYHAGRHIPVSQAQPGDLLFWAHTTSDPGSIHHVAIYLGDGTMVEAQTSGVPVLTSTVRKNGLMPLATRPAQPAAAPAGAASGAGSPGGAR